MIKKILTLKNVGLFRHGCSNGAVVFDQITAIYADNARGKSTFATVLRSCKMQDENQLNARRTIDVTDAPEVELLLDNNMVLKYESDAWDGTPPDIAIFDSEFVERNVYSGFSVRSDQRQELLNYALGDATVQLKKQVEKLSKSIQEQTIKISEMGNFLSGFASPLSLQQFIDLELIADAEEHITECQKRIEATKNVKQLNARSDPKAVELVQFDLSAIFDVLARQLVDIENTAETKVNTHIAKYGDAGLEDWISQGQGFQKGAPDCPFCGQSVSRLELIDAYRSYFNKAYQDLKEEVAALETKITSSLADTLANLAFSTAKINAARIEVWKDQLEINYPTLDKDVLIGALTGARNVLIPLAKQKLSAPLELVGTGADVEVAKRYIATANQLISDYNGAIDIIVSKVEDFKKKVAIEDIGALEIELQRLQASIRRQQPDAARACKDYQSAITEKERLNYEKEQKREQIDTLMDNTLTQYQTSINSILTTFGAKFSIDGLSTDYRGRSGRPQIKYGFKVRGQEVELGSGSDFSADHNFSTTLSESDKRTLAWAFFIARLEADLALDSKVIVLDDPVSSMDRNRRNQTIRRIALLATNCKQLIVLSHDAYFIRELRDHILKIRQTSIVPKVLQITRVENDYSAFSDCNLDEICESDYYRHHRMVAEYVNGKSAANIRDIAKAIRPLLEGYLHRRFPKHIPRNKMFGQIIADHIALATTGPLSHLRQHEAELREINDYASQFHHDTNQDADSVPVVDAELLPFASRALDMIYKNG